MKSELLVRVQDDDQEKTLWHISLDAAGSGYGTLCGMAAEGDVFGGTMMPDKPTKKTKVECGMCYRIWSNVMKLGLKESDFAVKKEM